MNNLLELKGKFEQAKREGRVGGPKLAKDREVKFETIDKLIKELEKINSFWQKQNLLSKALISVYYNTIVAKSNRMKKIFSKGSLHSNDSIVGARFLDERHIITHYIPYDVLESGIFNLKICSEIVKKEFDNVINYDKFNTITINDDRLKNYKDKISNTSFKQLIVDVSFIEKFEIFKNPELEQKTDTIVTVYKTGENIKDILEKIGITLFPHKILDETTFLLTPDELNILKREAPYLISMAVSDLSEFTKEDFSLLTEENKLSIPKPKNEPVIGVIDTLFDERIYFSDWVKYTECIDKNIPRDKNDYRHGTEISSIIVDGPSFNKKLDDGCGRFQIRHFGVATGSRFSSFSILKNIQNIVAKNRDIKVWNLSLGSKLEINKNSISPEAAILDKIQYDNDVIFVVAGTNKSEKDVNTKLIGSPADSINSLVVNSVKSNGEPASYTRTGPVLSFFVKPDVSYYGGEKNEEIRVCSPNGEALVCGTSFAAPWIARKLAYLIHILGLSKEVAKALLIHSATGWDKISNKSALSIGYGIVPIRIEDIINSKDDEIKFVISGISEKYDTYAYNIPVPKEKEKYPFIAKATLCYFPACSRNQGVDYTNTELDIHFGQVSSKVGGKIKSINSNFQNDEEETYLREKDARKLFRKWDNVKHISDVKKEKNRGKKVYVEEGKNNDFWGLSIKTIERLNEKFGENLKFGVVITLKEINGVNRIDSFIKNCNLFGNWLVNKIDIKNRIDIFTTAQEDVEWEE